MVYSNKFVVSLIYNGNVVVENKARIVSLPFGSEYSIRLRNKNDRRAVAKIYIDDENVSENGYIIPANSYIDIERFADVPQKFRVAAVDSDAAYAEGKGPRTDGANGVVRVEFLLERNTPKYHLPIIWYGSSQPFIWNDYSSHSCSPSASELKSRKLDGDYSHIQASSSNVLRANNAQIQKNTLDAVTVAGSESKQRFKEVEFIPENTEPTVLMLIIKGFVGVITQKIYCDTCGAKPNRKSAKFCFNCGSNLSAT